MRQKMAKKLKIWNGGDWDHEGGHLYVAAYSVKDACDCVEYGGLRRSADKIKNPSGGSDEKAQVHDIEEVPCAGVENFRYDSDRFVELSSLTVQDPFA
jgi:hypothetical protein